MLVYILQGTRQETDGHDTTCINIKETNYKKEIQKTVMWYAPLT